MVYRAMRMQSRSAPLLYLRDMSERGTKSSIIEALLCAWIVGAQLWYLLQFRPLLAFFGAKLLHHS
jgi:hypothetical protein